MYSALKRDGKPLYEYARAGQTVEREGRQVTIHALEMIACSLPDVTFRVTCSKGTYVRTLAEDIGEALGCGAHLVALPPHGCRRVDAGACGHAGCACRTRRRLSAIRGCNRSTLCFRRSPAVRLDADATRRFLHGQRLKLSEVSAGPP